MPSMAARMSFLSSTGTTYSVSTVCRTSANNSSILKASAGEEAATEARAGWFR